MAQPIAPSQCIGILPDQSTNFSRHRLSIITSTVLIYPDLLFGRTYWSPTTAPTSQLHFLERKSSSELESSIHFLHRAIVNSLVKLNAFVDTFKCDNAAKKGEGMNQIINNFYFSTGQHLVYQHLMTRIRLKCSFAVCPEPSLVYNTQQQPHKFETKHSLSLIAIMEPKTDPSK